MSYGVLESILDYKFLLETGLELSEYKNLEEMKSEVRKGYRKYGITCVNSSDGNKYYDGVNEISRREAIERVILRLGFRMQLKRYIE